MAAKPAWVKKQLAAATTPTTAPSPSEPPSDPPADFIDHYFECLSDWKYRPEIFDGQVFHVFARKDFHDDAPNQTLDEWFNAHRTF